MNFVGTVESAFKEFGKKREEYSANFSIGRIIDRQSVVTNRTTDEKHLFPSDKKAIEYIDSLVSKKFEKDVFIIGARFTSGATDVIQVEEASDGYILGRIKNANGSFSKTIRTIQTSTIEYWERVEQ